MATNEYLDWCAAAAAERLSQAGYGQPAIAEGLAYARDHDASGLDEVMSLALSRILYSDGQLEDGARFGWSQDNEP